MKRYASGALALCLLVGGAAGAEEKPKGDAKPASEQPAKKEGWKEKTFISPDDAGPDFKLQGEYAGEAGGNKLGAQVISIGDPKTGAINFRAVFEPGGLPGDGWDGKTRIEVDGKPDGEKALFEGKGYSATLADGKLSAKTDKGETVELKRVERHSPTEGLKAPEGAVVLFDGSGADHFPGGHLDEKRRLLASGPTGKDKFKDYTLHVEFLLPYKPYAFGQERANSGVYQQNRYEIQVLDSFGLKGLNNECAGIYSQTAPAVNMCYPPLTWQTYDIDFTAARYDADGKRTPPTVTVKHNGVVVHDKVEIKGPTGGGQKEDPKEPVQSGPIQLQGHGNPVYYRNVWVVEKK